MRKLAAPDRDLERSRVILGLLESVDRDAKGSQRARASEAGVALGLVNAYLNFCVKKGFIRIKKIPTRRYFYYLTPKGFAEKSRLALMLVSNSLRSFRQARQEYSAAFRSFKARGRNRVVLVGLSELTEIAMLCAAENDMVMAAIVAKDRRKSYLGVPVAQALSGIQTGFDMAVITDLMDPSGAYEDAVRALGADRVASPSILGITSRKQEAAE
jgi:hypothetical protein